MSRLTQIDTAAGPLWIDTDRIDAIGGGPPVPGALAGSVQRTTAIAINGATLILGGSPEDWHAKLFPPEPKGAPQFTAGKLSAFRDN